MKTTRKISRRSFLGRVAGSAVVAGGAFELMTGTARAQVTDNDSGANSDPVGGGRGSRTDTDPTDAVGQGRGITDGDPSDPAGRGRGRTGITDNDPGDRPGYGRRGGRRVTDSDPTDSPG
ncbi:MAG: twin-arginine translocation signal domain-containing protein, partial [Pseudomonadota bacterium]|nr:twin-arginine translocation signal domain-containing protein [Pseudomonadota bacterium]